MAQLNQLVCLALLVVEFVCLTIASHPTTWRRNAEARNTHTSAADASQSEEIPANNSHEIPSDSAESSQPDHPAHAADFESTTTSTCPTCWMQEQQKQFRIDSLKKHILEQLRLTHAPNITVPATKNPALRRLLSDYPQLHQSPTMMSDGPQMEEQDSTPANLERILIFAKRPLQTFGTLPSGCCYFNVAEKTAGYRVTSAELYVYVSPARSVQTTTPHQLSIRMVMSSIHTGHVKLRTVANEKVQLSRRTGEWRSIDFTNVVQGWAAEPDTNMGIVVELYDDEGNSVVVTETSPEEPKRPFLQLRLEDARRRRQKRQVENMCSEDDRTRDCCLRPLRVNFEQFGWDWIISPKQYMANYCFGSCPNHYLYRYPHTQLISQMDRMAVAGPCCSPSKMRPISLLMFDEEYDIIFAELPDMSVEHCSCS